MRTIDGWRQRRPIGAATLMRSFTRVGDIDFTTFRALIIVLCASADERLLVAMGLIGSLVLTTALATSLKRIVRRPRPRVAMPGLTTLVADPDAYAFPSGHAAAAAAVATIAIMADHPAAEVEVLLAMLIGSSRVYLGAHYPVDVAAGTSIGIVTAFTLVTAGRLLLF